MINLQPITCIAVLAISSNLLANTSDPCIGAEDKFACITAAIDEVKIGIDTRIAYLSTEVGPQGPVGDKGDTGEQGDKGPVGADSKTPFFDKFTERVEEVTQKATTFIDFEQGYITNPLNAELENSLAIRIQSLRKRLSDLNRNPNIMHSSADSDWNSNAQRLDFPKNSEGEYLTSFIYAKGGEALSYSLNNENSLESTNADEFDNTYSVQQACVGLSEQQPYYCLYNEEVNYKYLLNRSVVTEQGATIPFQAGYVLPELPEQPTSVDVTYDYDLDYRLGKDKSDPLYLKSLNVLINLIIDDNAAILAGIDAAIENVENILSNNDTGILDSDLETFNALLVNARIDYAQFPTQSFDENKALIENHLSNQPFSQNLLTLVLTDLYLEFQTDFSGFSDEERNALTRMNEQLPHYLVLFKQSWKAEVEQEIYGIWRKYTGFTFNDFMNLSFTPDFVLAGLTSFEERALANQAAGVQAAFETIKAFDESYAPSISDLIVVNSVMGNAALVSGLTPTPEPEPEQPASPEDELTNDSNNEAATSSENESDEQGNTQEQNVVGDVALAAITASAPLSKGIASAAANLNVMSAPMPLVAQAVAKDMTGEFNVADQVDKNLRYTEFMNEDFLTTPNLNHPQVTDNQRATALYVWLALKMGI